MQITTPQPHLWPTHYFAGAEAPEEEKGSGAPRWVIRTKPRTEKKIARFAEAAGVPYFVPATQRRKVYGNRSVRTSWLPVFPGYFFVLAEQYDRVALLRSNAVLQQIRVPDPGELYRDLANLWRTLVTRPGAVEEDTFVPGVPVQVSSGPMAGVVGELVERRKGGTRLLIKVHLLGRAVSVDIDSAHVRRLS